MKETITRSLTGLAFISLIIASLVIHPIFYLVLFSLICAGAWIEYSRLFPERLTLSLVIQYGIFLLGNFILFYLASAKYLSSGWLLIFPAVLLPLLLVQWILKPSGSAGRITVILGGLIYLTAGFSLMHFLAFPVGGENGYTPRWILFTFYFLWTNDSMAYVSGRLLGKHRIWPAVSPGKTWEGSMGGALFAVVLAVILSKFYTEFSLWEWIGFAGIVIFFGSLGDFFESWMKRKAGVKDSGRLLPGHGGILDRFDSFILAVPFVALYVNFVI